MILEGKVKGKTSDKDSMKVFNHQSTEVEKYNKTNISDFMDGEKFNS